MIPKFRAWNKNKRKMYSVDGFRVFDNKVYRSSLANDEFRKNRIETIHFVEDNLDDFILMQSTGLKDRNGAEVFDGDILAYQCTYEIHGTEEVETSIVDFKNTVPFLKRENIEQTLDDILLDGSEYKVIGNIYEHKHLLEVE